MDLTVEEKNEIEIRLVEIQTIVNILPLIEIAYYHVIE